MGRRVDGSLGTLLQGVSQQPVRQRLAGQVTEQTNMTSDPVRMLHRRPPTQYVGKFSLGPIESNDAFTHYFELSDGTAYYLIIPANALSTDIKLLNADTGVENTNTTITAAFLSYVSVASPRTTLKAVTVGDLTYIVNTTVSTALLPDLTNAGAADYLLDSARVDIEVGQYSRDYVVTVTAGGSDYSVTHSTPTSTSSGAEAAIAVDNIAEEIETLMNKK